MAHGPSSSGSPDSPGAGERPQAPLEEFARRVHDQASLRKLDAAAVEAFAAFDAAGVDALLLKGPALARMLYEPGERRGYVDVDLLVSPRDLQAARQVLADLGYRNALEPFGIDEMAADLDSETWARTGDSASAGLMIDLHRRLPGSRAAPQPAWDALATGRTELDIDGRCVPVFSRSGLALHVATHAAQHGLSFRGPIEDLTKALERWPPEVWRGAEMLAREVEATGAFAAGLRLVPAGAALALDLGLPGTDDLEWAIAHAHARPRGSFHLQSLAEARTFRERAAMLRRSVLPRREWIASEYWWARGRRGRMAVAYSLHLIRVPVWAYRTWRFRRRASRAGG